MVRYSTALSHIFLAATGLYCLKSLSGHKFPLGRLSIGLVIFHSVLGVWRWGNPVYGYKIDKLYKLTDTLQDVLVLPLIVTTIWLKYNYSQNIAWAHTLTAVVPLTIYLYKSQRRELLDAFLACNILSLILVSYRNDNLFGFNTSVSFVLSYFVIKRDMLTNLPFEVPTQDLFNYSWCFFIFFSLRTILDHIY